MQEEQLSLQVVRVGQVVWCLQCETRLQVACRGQLGNVIVFSISSLCIPECWHNRFPLDRNWWIPMKLGSLLLSVHHHWGVDHHLVRFPNFFLYVSRGTRLLLHTIAIKNIPCGCLGGRSKSFSFHWFCLWQININAFVSKSWFEMHIMVIMMRWVC